MSHEPEEQYEVDELEGVRGFAGRYNIERELGAGSYGRVYKAVDTHFGESGITRAVALKVLKPMSGRSEGDRYGDGRRERFLREARMVASLKDDRIVEIYDKGEKNGLVFAAYEYVEGETLAQYLNRGKVFSPLEWVKLLEQILDALAEAHSRDIVHRDIKPANLMITSHERRGYEVKVLDFGIGKYVGSDEVVQRQFDTMTNVGEAVGTERYMSPEQIKGHRPTAAADVWALGLVSVGALTGELALPAEGPTLMYQITAEEPLEVAPDLSHVPGHLREVIDRMLEKDLAKRYENAQEVLRDLEELKGASNGWEHSGLVEADHEVADTFDAATVPEPLRAEFVETSESQTQKPASSADEEDESRWGVWLAVGVALLVVGGWWAWPTDQPNTEPPAEDLLKARSDGTEEIRKAEAQKTTEQPDEQKPSMDVGKAQDASAEAVGVALLSARKVLEAGREPRKSRARSEAKASKTKDVGSRGVEDDTERAAVGSEKSPEAKREERDAEKRPKEKKAEGDVEKEAVSSSRGEKQAKDEKGEGGQVSTSAGEEPKQPDQDKEVDASKDVKRPIIWGVE